MKEEQVKLAPVGSTNECTSLTRLLSMKHWLHLSSQSPDVIEHLLHLRIQNSVLIDKVL